MIYCCPQSEWFLLGAMEGDLPLFEGRIASLWKGELQFAPTSVPQHLLKVSFIGYCPLSRSRFSYSPIWRGLLESFGRCH